MLKKLILLFIISMPGHQGEAQTDSFVELTGYSSGSYRAKYKALHTRGCIARVFRKDTAGIQTDCDGTFNETAQLIRYDSTGRCVWRVRDNVWNAFLDFDITEDNKIYVVGVLAGGHLRKYDLNGQLLDKIPIQGYVSRIRTDKHHNYYFQVDVSASNPFSFNGYTLTTKSSQLETHLVKFNSNDQVIWCKEIHFTGQSGSTFDFIIDEQNNIIIGTTFNSSLTLNGVTVATGGSGSCLMKFDSDLKSLWNKSFYGASPLQIATDQFNDIYIMSKFCTQFQIENIQVLEEVPPSMFCGDHVLVKLTSAGQVQWLNHIRTPGGDEFIPSFAVSPHGYSYFLGIASFLKLNDDSIKSTTAIQSFFARLDRNGRLIWHEFLSGDEQCLPENVCVTKDEQAFFAGTVRAGIGYKNFSKTATCIIGPPSFLIGEKFTSEITNIQEDKVDRMLHFYPNPVKEFLILKPSILAPFYYKIIDVTGSIIRTGKSDSGYITVTEPKGLYFMHIKTFREEFTIKYFKD